MGDLRTFSANLTPFIICTIKMAQTPIILTGHCAVHGHFLISWTAQCPVNIIGCEMI